MDRVCLPNFCLGLFTGCCDGNEKINSGKLRATGYDARARLLQVQLDDGSMLQYGGVGGSLGLDGAQLSALGNGVKEGKWFSLMGKATRPVTLAAAWRKVAGNGGAAGVDRQSIKRFSAKSGEYLGELARSLDERNYRSQHRSLVSVSLSE